MSSSPALRRILRPRARWRVLRQAARDFARPGRHGVLFLNWYGWVESPLKDVAHRILGPQYGVDCVSRDEVLARGRDRLSDASWLRRNDLTQAAYDGLNLWEICRSCICDELLDPSPNPTVHREVFERHYMQAAVLIEGFKSFFTDHPQQTIVVEQGLQYDMRCAVEIARRFSTRTVAIENSFLRDYFFMDDVSGSIVNRHRLARNAGDLLRARQLNEQQREEVHALLRRTAPTFTPPPEAQTDGGHGADGRTCVLLLGQVATDASLTMDGGSYADQVEFMMDAARIMESHADTHRLIIRLHPKEGDGLSYHGKPMGNVTYRRLCKRGMDRMPHVSIYHSQQVNTYSLIARCAFGLTINSQSGLELLAMHKPLIVAGDAFYGRKGFTSDLSSRSQLPALVERMLQSPELSEPQKHDVDRFLQYLMFEYLFPKDLNGCEERVRRMLQ